MDDSVAAVGVIGAGLMGAGIVEVCARRDCDVICYETSGEALRTGRARIEGSLSRAVTKSKMSEAERDATLSRIRYTTDLETLRDREYVFEAVVEDPNVKLALFKRLDQVVASPEAVLASNTSSIPIMKLASATGRVRKNRSILPRPAGWPGLEWVSVMPRLASARSSCEDTNALPLST